MLTEKEMKCKELAEKLDMFYDIMPWEIEMALEKNNLNLLKHYEKVCGRKRFCFLDVRAKVNCMEQFLNLVIPYAPEWDDETDLDDLVATIDEWVGEQFYFDRDGNWYDEGRRMRA